MYRRSSNLEGKHTSQYTAYLDGTQRSDDLRKNIRWPQVKHRTLRACHCFWSQRYLLINTRSKSDTIPIKVGIRVERNCQTNWDPSLLTTKCLDTPYKKPDTITDIYEWWKNISSTTATPSSQLGFVLTPARRTGLIQWYWFVRNAPDTGVAVRQLRRHPGTSDNGCYQRVQQHLGWNDEIPIHAKSELIDAPPNPK